MAADQKNPLDELSPADRAQVESMMSRENLTAEQAIEKLRKQQGGSGQGQGGSS